MEVKQIKRYAEALVGHLKETRERIFREPNGPLLLKITSHLASVCNDPRIIATLLSIPRDQRTLLVSKALYAAADYVSNSASLAPLTGQDKVEAALEIRNKAFIDNGCGLTDDQDATMKTIAIYILASLIGPITVDIMKEVITASEFMSILSTALRWQGKIVEDAEGVWKSVFPTTSAACYYHFN